MTCTNCGKALNKQKKGCLNCGKNVASQFSPENNQVSVKNRFSKIIKYIFIGLFIFGTVSSVVDQPTIDNNNEGLNSLNSGDFDSAIISLEKAIDTAFSKENKRDTRLNLAYAYLNNLMPEKALSAFNDSLEYADKDSFKYYLISAEIALLEYDAELTLQNLNKAYEIQPDDFQVNNALNLFYLDLADVFPEFYDPLKALKHAKKANIAVDDSIKNIAVHNLAIAHYFNEEYDDAILMFLEDTTDSPYLYNWLGLAYFGAGEFENSKFYFEKALAAGVPINTEIYNQL